MIFACAISMFQWCRMQIVGVRVFKVDTFSVSWLAYVSGDVGSMIHDDHIFSSVSFLKDARRRAERQS